MVRIGDYLQYNGRVYDELQPGMKYYVEYVGKDYAYIKRDSGATRTVLLTSWDKTPAGLYWEHLPSEKNPLSTKSKILECW